MGQHKPGVPRRPLSDTDDPHAVVKDLHTPPEGPFKRAIRAGWKIAKTPVLVRTAADLTACENFVIFIGYPGSGHTLLGSMLNAHPEILVSNELDALFYLDNGLSGKALLGAIIAHDLKFARKGRQNSKGYDYATTTSGFDTGRPIKTIGDKKGFRTAQRLCARPHLLKKLVGRVRLPVKVIHLTRNPFDLAASYAKWNGHPPHVCAWQVAEMARLADQAAKTVSADNCLLVRYEDIVAKPNQTMVAACDFLGCSQEPSDLDSAVSLVEPRHARPADTADWPEKIRAEIAAITDRYPAFASYADDPRRPAA